jgi:hypothetical protein
MLMKQENSYIKQQIIFYYLHENWHYFEDQNQQCYVM